MLLNCDSVIIMQLHTRKEKPGQGIPIKVETWLERPDQNAALCFYVPKLTYNVPGLGISCCAMTQALLG